MSFEEQNNNVEEKIEPEESGSVTLETKEDSVLPEVQIETSNEEESVVSEDNEVVPEEVVEELAPPPAEVTKDEKLQEIRTKLFDGVNANEIKPDEPQEVLVTENSEPINIPSGKKPGGIVNTMRRWMGIAGVAAIGLGAMQESQAQSAPPPKVEKKGFFGGLLQKAQQIDAEMAIEKRMYGNYWSPGPNQHIELRTYKGYAADVVDVVHVDQNGNVVRVLQRAVHRKDVPVGITVGISGGHGQGRVLPGQVRRVPSNLYQANMMKQQGVNIGTMVQRSTGRVTMEVKPVKK